MTYSERSEMVDALQAFLASKSSKPWGVKSTGNTFTVTASRDRLNKWGYLTSEDQAELSGIFGRRASMTGLELTADDCRTTLA